MFCLTIYDFSDVVLARSELLVKKVKVSPLETFHEGVQFGVVLVLLLWVVWNATTDAMAKYSKLQMPIEVVRLYRSTGLLYLCFWCWTCCVIVFTKSRVNYRYMFEFDPRHTYDQTALLNKSLFGTIIYLGNILLYYKAARDDLVILRAEEYVLLF